MSDTPESPQEVADTLRKMALEKGLPHRDATMLALGAWIEAVGARDGNVNVGLARHKKGHWLVAAEFGEEAEDSPMVGGARYGTGDTLNEAVLDMLGVEVNVEQNRENEETGGGGAPMEEAAITLPREKVQRLVDEVPMAPWVEQRLRTLIARSAKANVQIEVGPGLDQISADGFRIVQEAIAIIDGKG